MLQLSVEKTLRHQVSPKTTKPVSVLAISTPVTETKKKTVGTAKVVETAKAVETAKTGKNGGESKDEYLENLVQVLCIRYPINFGKKSVSALLDLVARSMQSTQPLPKN